MEKKTKTVKQLKNKYRALQYTTFGGEILSILAPYIALGIANREEWFMTQEGWRVGLGGALALALMGIAILLVTKKKEDNTITHGFITLIVGWFAVAFVFLLLENILEQITTIMFYGGFGLLGAFGLNMISENCKEKADAYQNAMKNVRQKSIEQKVQDDLNSGRIKF